MTLLLAIMFFVAGGICLTRPRSVVEWMTSLAARMQGKDVASLKATENQGLLLFVRVIGFLALINAVMMMFVSSIPIDGN